MKESDADLEFVRKIRRKRRFRLSTYIPLLIIAGVVGVVGGGAMLVIAAKALPTLGSESWTHVELANYLKSRGISVYRCPGHAGVYYMADPPRAGFSDSEYQHMMRFGGEIVLVNLMASPTQAREIASQSEVSFSWGRFVIVGSGDYATSIRAALGNK